MLQSFLFIVIWPITQPSVTDSNLNVIPFTHVFHRSVLWICFVNHGGIEVTTCQLYSNEFSLHIVPSPSTR
jgi:hypothetical protein